MKGIGIRVRLKDIGCQRYALDQSGCAVKVDTCSWRAALELLTKNGRRLYIYGSSTRTMSISTMRLGSSC